MTAPLAAVFGITLEGAVILLILAVIVFVVVLPRLRR